MKCQDCIFGKKIEDESVECNNPYSDDFETSQNISHECKDGKSCTVGIDATQNRFLRMM